MSKSTDNPLMEGQLRRRVTQHKYPLRGLVYLLLCLLVPLAIVRPASAGTLGSATWTAGPANDLRTGIPNSRYDWGFVTATAATLTRVDMTVPATTYGTGSRYADLPGTTGNYFSTADSSTNSIGGDIDVRAKASFASWTPAAASTLIAKSSDDAGSQKSFKFLVNSDGTLQFSRSTSCSAFVDYISSMPTGFAGGATQWVRATLTQNNGSGSSVATFYTSSDGSSWTQLGSATTSSNVSATCDSTSAVEIGSRGAGQADLSKGKIYYAELRNGIGGTVANVFNPVQDTIQGLSWPSSSSVAETWTLNRNGSNLPADIASDLTVSSVSGISAGGTARVREVDAKAIYLLPSAASTASSTAASIALTGFTNTNTAGTYTSTITTFDNSATPASVDSAITASLVASAPTITTAAGAQVSVPTSGGVAATSTDMVPYGVAAYGGNVYISDTWSNNVYKVDSSGSMIRVTGNNYAGSGTGVANTALMNSPKGMSFDSSGNLFIANSAAYRIQEISSGNLTNVAGNGTQSYSNGPATSSSINTANSVTVDSSGTMWISDTVSQRIRKVVGGTMSTVAGSGTAGYTGEGAGTTYRLNFPQQTAADSSGNLYIADERNNRIRKLDTSGNLSTVVGTGTASSTGDGSAAGSATINYPHGLAVDTNGDMYISEQGGNTIRKVTASTGKISTIAGTGAKGFGGDGGLATAAVLSYPEHLTLDGAGALYVVDKGNNRVRKIVLSTGIISTVAGSGVGAWSGDGGPSAAAHLWHPLGLTTDASGNTYIADTSNAAIRKIDGTGTISTVAGLGPYETGNTGDSGYATAARLTTPVSTAVDASGNVFILDTGNTNVRKIDTSGYISTVGTYAGYVPQAMAISPVAPYNLYFTTSNCLIVQLTQAGVFSTYSGTAGTCTSSANGTAVGAATYNNPYALTFDSSGNMFVSETPNQGFVREISTAGVVTLFSGGTVSTADNTAFASVTTPNPRGLAFDASGNLYIAGSGRVRRATNTGPSFRTAGTGTSAPSAGDGGSALAASFGQLFGAAYTRGNLYVGDYSGSVVRRISNLAGPDTAPTTPSASSLAQYRSDGTTSIGTGLWTPQSTVVVSGPVADSDAGDTMALCVELQPVGTSFTNTNTACSYERSTGTASIALSGLLTNTAYHWQARVRDASYIYSGWTSFGSNLETASDFGVDLSAPTAGSALDGLGGVEQAFNGGSLSALDGSWSGFSDGGSGIARYDYSVGSTPGGSDILGWTSAALATTASPAALTLQTSTKYFVSVRAVDAVGNVSALATSPGQMVKPTLNVTQSAALLDFGYMAPGTSATKTVDVGVSTNAHNGYKVYAYSASPLSDGLGHSIAPFAGGTVTAPNAWQLSDTGFGLTSADTLVGGSNIYQAATCPGGLSRTGAGCYAPLASTPQNLVVDHEGTITGTPVSGETTTLTFKLSLAANQVAGHYSLPVSFSVVPAF